MTVFITKNDNVITVMARVQSLGIVGDSIWDVKPGQSLFGHSYEWWNEQPVGKIEVNDARRDDHQQ